jgi:hypothetical protein
MFLCITALVLMASAPSADDVIARTEYLSTVDGKTMVTIVGSDSKQLADYPSWTPTSAGPPPLDPKEAIELSRPVVDALMGDSPWRLSQIALERLGNVRWLYVVRYEKEARSKDLLQVPVLLNGRAIWPETSEDDHESEHSK